MVIKRSFFFFLFVLLFPVLGLQRRITFLALWAVIVFDVASFGLFYVDTLSVEPFFALVACDHKPIIGRLNTTVNKGIP